MKIDVRSGFHSPALHEDIRRTWQGDDRLLVITSPQASSNDYVPLLEKTDWPSAPVFGVFTSGTVSGHPRLVVYSRRNIEASLEAVMSVFESKRITSIFGYPQPFHTFGLTLGYLLAEYLKVPLHFHEGKYSQEAHVSRARVTDAGLLTLGTPAHFYDLIRSGLELAPSYSAIIGGASVDPQLWRDVRDRAHIEAPSIGYGCTEAAPAITHLGPGVEPRIAGEIGFPLKNLHSHSFTGRGVEISGDSLCMAIVDNGRVTFPTKLTIADDIHVRADASWIFKGRLDLIINRGGVKIALEDVERLIRDKTGTAAVAFALTSERLGQDLGVAVTSNLEQTRALVSEHFNMKPNVFHIAEFPLNVSGKIDRQAVAQMVTP